MEVYILGYKSVLPSSFVQKEVSLIKETSYLLGNIEIDKNSSFYPSRSDEKIMRHDVKASIIMINELIRDLQLENSVESSPLFVANGAFIEDSQKHLTKLTSVYQKFTDETSTKEKAHKIYRSSPPLVALETLTNSSMSFIAQYAGFKGHNFTFGNTSLSAYYAISEAISVLNNTDLSFVISSNSAGSHSFLTNSTVLGYSDKWKESAAVASVILTNNKEYKNNAVVKITDIKQGLTIPNLETNVISRNWKDLLPNKKADFILFSGAFSDSEYQLDYDYCSLLASDIYSHFVEYGNLGSSNITVSIIKAVDYIKNGYKIIDILDRDIYGRESLIRIEKC